MSPTRGPGVPKLGGGRRPCHTIAIWTWQELYLGGGEVIWVHERPLP